MRWLVAFLLTGLIVPTVLAEGGEGIETALEIVSLPFQDAGDTCDNLDDYDADCPDPGSTAKDVVYVFRPAADVVVDISLCASGYDTKLYIWADSAGTIVACNDDEGCGYDTWQSAIHDLELSEGHSYYIVVDGHGASCGPYLLDVEGQSPCVVECPPGSLQEGEPPCLESHDDVYNSGCDGAGWTPILAQDGVCGDMCGRTCVREAGGEVVPDVDWYTMTAAGGSVSVVLEPELQSLLEVGLADGCESWGGGMTVVSPCQQETLGGPLPAGQEFWVRVQPYYVPPSAEGGYHLHVCGIQGSPTPVDVRSWGRIKSTYRDSGR